MSKNLLDQFIQEALQAMADRQKALEERISNSPQPAREVVQRMLDDVEAITNSRFCEESDPVASPIDMLRVEDDKHEGELFYALSGREKFQVLGDYTAWQQHVRDGIDSEVMDQVFLNVVRGKPREQWLDHTGLAEASPAPPEQTEDRSRGR